jgi:hypothetical protein
VPDCLGKPVDRCTVVHGDGLHVMLVGDSVAQMWASAFTEIARREKFTLSIASLWGCPWQRGVQYADPIGGTASLTRCRAHQADFYGRVIPQLHPDVIIIAQRAYDDPVRNIVNTPLILPNGKHVHQGMAGYEADIRRVTSRSLAVLQHIAPRIVLIEPGPIPPTAKEPITCLSAGTDPSKCSFRATPGPLPMTQYFRGLARSDAKITTLDLDRLECPRLPICDSVVNDMIVWRGGSHITATFARSLWEPIDRLLHDQGVLPAR